MDKTKIAVDVFNKSAKEYQDRFMDVDLYNDSFDIFCSSVTKVNAEVLELACGPGNCTRYVIKNRPDFNILGTDLAPNMLELARNNNPSATFQLMDCRDILLLNKKYDAILCGFCLPYLSKAESEKLIDDAATILNPNGILYISTMEETEDNKSGFKSSSSDEYRAYIYYHQADYLLNALEKNGFKIIHFKRQDYPTTDGTKTVDLLIIAQK
ncbi:class I SAM-dependent DNA methyltransferase [Flavobacterium sp.]|uniref:class I SAM-dependent DNA methyltransferase n=1 Tax=Flavobacterium sp. TaxID=239 RepID=UPI003D6ACBEF